ncbi:uncharacterized protein VTP21DRAFT_3643 [Calcarisporiella thermophila]|uniref:uncharacterized protein n=1 Tax=Calcarisporiella thermophila TaxID=911321 RepID=UPI003744A01F
METEGLEELLRDYFHALGCLDYELAARVGEQIAKTHSFAGSLLIKLRANESLYTSLAFLKTSQRKNQDPLDTIYSDFRLNTARELRHLQERPENYSQLLAVLYKELEEFAQIRQTQMDIYRSLSILRPEDSSAPIREVISQAQMQLSSIQGYTLGTLLTTMEYELKTLQYLLTARDAIADYSLKDATSNLYLCKMEILKLSALISRRENLEKLKDDGASERSWSERSLGGLGIFASAERFSKRHKTSTTPFILAWFPRYLAHLNSKLTLYFMGTLLETEMILGGDLRTLWRKVDARKGEESLYTMIRDFRKRSGAHNVCLLYKVTDDVRFYPRGYGMPGEPYVRPTGLDSFPCIFCYPENPPKEHWPNVISLIQDGSCELADFARTGPLYFYDGHIGATYFIAQMDTHALLVVIYVDKHSKNDPTAKEFFDKVGGRIRGVDVTKALTT